ncbi:hypothetical protein ANCCAN_27743 [Ancylostoma caninum]|uniref:Beta-lactamase-related domain-containing protein n=1 Tax=Ancylostoma caninum TaxID=29170 RepID=A0A368F6D1_ANCCA|nr:hypothetical protein ANCCAN_27743 [Ancylostoma caninum]
MNMNVFSATTAWIEEKRNNEYIDGIAVDGFEDVKEVFQSAKHDLARFQTANFRDRLEHDGAALAVYHKGKPVVDLWGGWADRENDRNWTRDTIANIFSCTKSVAAICVAMKVHKRECAYTDKVADFWPQFGRNGKQDITIDMILTHRVGMFRLCASYAEHLIFLGIGNFCPDDYTNYRCLELG